MLAELADKSAVSAIDRIRRGIERRQRMRVDFAKMVVLVEYLDKKLPVALNGELSLARCHQRLQPPGFVQALEVTQPVVQRRCLPIKIDEQKPGPLFTACLHQAEIC